MPNGNTDYRMGQLDQGFKDIHSRLDKMDTKLDDMIVWRWKTGALISAVSVSGSVVGTYVIPLLLNQL